MLEATRKHIEWKRSQRKPNAQRNNIDIYHMGLYERIKRCKSMKEFQRLVLYSMIFDHKTNPYPQRYIKRCNRALKRKDAELQKG